MKTKELSEEEQPLRVQKLAKGDKHEVNLKPPAHRKQKDSLRSFRSTCRGVGAILMLVGATSRRGKAKAAKERRERSAAAARKQRAAVRITYAKSKTKGHWEAHGKYIQREAATGDKQQGFDKAADDLDIPPTLASWQASGDERLFKIIISPERSAGLDMRQYTREVMAQVEKDSGTRLQWVAAIHTNTDHPHVHVALRGIQADGSPLTFTKEYIKTGFRAHAQNMATRQMGFRTPEDMERALLEEATKPRQTSLDRLIVKHAVEHASSLRFSVNAASLDKMRTKDPSRLFALERRMYHLESMGMATRMPDKTWELSKSFEADLKLLTFAGDKQRMLARNMEPASTVGNPIVSARWNDIQLLHARILGHGEDDASGKRFMLLERVDGTVLMLPHRSDIEAMRAKHELKRNEFITVSRRHGRLEFIQHGSAEKILKDPAVLLSLTESHDPSERRPGWLGRLDAATREASSLLSVTLTQRQVDQLLESSLQGRSAFNPQMTGSSRIELANLSLLLRYNRGGGGYIAAVTPEQKKSLEALLASRGKQKGRAAQAQHDAGEDLERG